MIYKIIKTIVRGLILFIVFMVSITCNKNIPKKLESFDISDSRDGNIYKALKIGEQTWMLDNMAYLPSVSLSTDGSSHDPYYYVYDYEGTDVSAAKVTDNYKTYGVLYNWEAARTACRVGWHLPSDDEWDQLIDYLGGENDAGGKMKETESNYWKNPNIGATNSSNFSALPGGYRFANGSFDLMGTDAIFWSSSEIDSNTAGRLILRYYYSETSYSYSYEGYGFSVRCLKDEVRPETQ